MNSHTFVARLFLFLFFGSVASARTYELQNYPTEQGGHTLSGFVTTTDDAADDGLLMVDEIVDWEFSVAGPNSFSDSFSDAALPGIVGDVVITAEEITLAFPPNDPGFNAFELVSNGRSRPGLSYLRVNEPLVAGTFDQYTGSVSGTEQAWQTFPSELGGTNPWVIAIAIPEPSSIQLAIFSLTGIGSIRRRYRKR